MTNEELQKLDEEKRDCLYNAEEVMRARRIIEEMKDMDYVEGILSDEHKRLRNKIEELHNKMFPPKT